jgi:rare lipoprotein A
MKWVLYLVLTIVLLVYSPSNTHTVRGIASWYGAEFQGHKMANGHKFDRYAYTAASRTYPMGTVLSVYYPRTRRRVTVVVTDRGPWVKSRELDLSEQAAKDLGLIPYGIGIVEITTKEK